MPLVPGQHNGPLLGRLLQVADALLEDIAFNGLPFPVELAQPGGQLVGPGGIPRKEQFHGHLRHSHPAGGVDAGGQGIAHGDGGYQLVLQAGAANQAGKAQPAGRVQLF